MKVRNSKEQQRQRLRRDMEQFLSRGGRIEEVPSGTSGDNPDQPRQRRAFPFAQTPRATRTDLSQLAADIDARKKRGKRRQPRKAGPRRRLIYDDFGEPLRWVWDD